ncbi:hypothetical protein Tco_0854498 [Tanacetum coccineum]
MAIFACGNVVSTQVVGSMDSSMLLMRWRDLGLSCLVLVDVLVTLGGGVGGDESRSVVGDSSGVGGGRSGSVVGDGSGVVFGEVCVSGVFVESMVVGVGDSCGDCEVEEVGVGVLGVIGVWMLEGYVPINEWESELESEWILPVQEGVCVFSQLWHFVEECMDMKFGV